MVPMMDDGEHNPMVFDVRLSSTVPDRVTGDYKSKELTNMDLAMKLHYLKGVYFFNNEAVGGFTRLTDFKNPTFAWLGLFNMTTTRIRRGPETDRPFLKCNDGGIRFVEARCAKTIDEWLAREDLHSLNGGLVYSESLGPVLFFSPLVYLQITRFKCGGVSVGLSWAHVLGDAFSAVDFLNSYGQFLSGQRPQCSLKAPNTRIPPKHPQSSPATLTGKPFSVKRVDPVGDHWVVPNSRSPHKMDSHCFRITPKQLERLSQTAKIKDDNKHFEGLSALVWKTVAKIRGNSLPRIVTICRTNDSHDRRNEIPRNGQSVGVADVDFDVAEADLWELVELIHDKTVDESEVIEDVMERENANNVDFVVYGANLTFVDLEEANVYGMEIMGHKPVFATYSIEGVGDEGVVLVLPMPPGNIDEKGGGRGGGRMVNVTLPRDQLVELKGALKREWGIV